MKTLVLILAIVAIGLAAVVPKEEQNQKIRKGYSGHDYDSAGEYPSDIAPSDADSQTEEDINSSGDSDEPGDRSSSSEDPWNSNSDEPEPPSGADSQTEEDINSSDDSDEPASSSSEDPWNSNSDEPEPSSSSEDPWNSNSDEPEPPGDYDWSEEPNSSGESDEPGEDCSEMSPLLKDLCAGRPIFHVYGTPIFEELQSLLRAMFCYNWY